MRIAFLSEVRRISFFRRDFAAGWLGGAALVVLLGAAGCAKSATSAAEAESGPSSSGAAPARAPVRAFTVVDLKPSAGELEALLPGEVKKARAAGQKPFVECTADWCPPCVAIQKSLDDPQMVDAFKNTYIIRLDVDAWGLTALEKAGFDASTIPVFYALDEAGRSSKRSIDGGAWGDNTSENMAPPLKEFFEAGR